MAKEKQADPADQDTHENTLEARIVALEVANLKLKTALLGFISNPSAISADPALCNAVQEALK